jgi:hypothetical protein
MKIDNKKAKSIILSALLLMCFMTPGLVRAQDGPINAGIAVMLPGQSKSFVASSDVLPDIMLIPVYLYGTGVLNISISESSPETNLFVLLERGTGYPNFKYRVGTSPRTMSISLNIYDEAFILIAGAILYSPEAGPYQFTVSLNFS